MTSRVILKRSLLVSVCLLILTSTALGKVIYVDADATGANDGSTWADAYRFLQDALANARSETKPVEIWVAQGVYTPDSNAAEPNGTGDREATFQLMDNVAMYGGFPPGGGSWGERDPNLYESTLSGDLDGNDVAVSDPCDLVDHPNRGENSYHVVTADGTSKTAILDGFTITAGNANGSGSHKTGAGMLNTVGNPTVHNCTFTSNSAVANGGGIYNSSKGNPALSDCLFMENSANNGGGMYNWEASSTLLECIFSGNSARADGGAMGIRNGGSGVFVGCKFSGNSAQNGGAIYCYTNCDANLVNCTFSGNSALVRGGAMYNIHGCRPTLTECTLTANTARLEGGGMYNYWCDSLLAKCCTFTENAAYDGGGMCTYDTSAEVSACTLSANSAENKGGGPVLSYRVLGWPRTSD